MAQKTSIFIGGPIDGHTRVMEPAQDERLKWQDGEPPIMVWVSIAPVTPQDDTDDELNFTRVAYARRRETQLNAEFGSVWEYVYVPPEPEAS